jgi:hypothetical protein
MWPCLSRNKQLNWVVSDRHVKLGVEVSFIGRFGTCDDVGHVAEAVDKPSQL